MKIFFTLTVLTAGLLLAADEVQKDSATKIRELHKQRIATLKEFMEVTVGLRKNGASSYAEVVQSRLMLMNAELEAAETAKDRVAILEKIVEMLKENETTTELGLKSGEFDYPTFIKAKADRLKAEIDLEQAKK